MPAPNDLPEPRGPAFVRRSRGAAAGICAASPEEWEDWRWQLAHSSRTLSELARRMGWDAGRLERLPAVARRYPLRVTPYYLSLVDPDDPADPIGRQCIPAVEELGPPAPGATPDPLAEDESTPTPGLVHRYPDRVLLLTTPVCAVHCRHCFRKRYWRAPFPALDSGRQAAVLAYLRAHPEVREVLLSGGDPLLLPERRLGELLAALRSVPSVGVIRIGTRLPVVLPQRLTPEFCRSLGACAPVWVATHFNHPREVTREAAAACRNLLAAGIPVLNQTVLLRGVNDRTEVLAELFRALVEIQVKPYYLFVADPAEGAMHFRTGVDGARRIATELRGRLSGLAMPTLAADLPEGGGKVALEECPERCGPDGVRRFRSFDGRWIAYPEPEP